MVKFFKKILVSWLGREFVLVKILSVLKNSFTTFKTISKINLKHSFMLIPKIISSQYIFEFQKNSQLNELKNNYNFNYKDWSSAKTRGMWRKSLSKINNIKYLEIGCFEGRSAMFIGEQENTKEITCVDTFQGTEEQKGVDFDLVYNNCSKNLSSLSKIKTKLIKDTSDNFFSKSNDKFNLIYIDGYHVYEYVKKDFINSMKYLEKNGILICDDFLWIYYKDPRKNPIGAIIECYEKYKDDLKIEFINYQIIFKKIT